MNARPKAMDATPGWHPDPEDAGLERYWTGTEWANDWRPRAAPEHAAPAPPASGDELGAAIAAYVAQGARVAYRDGRRAVLTVTRPFNHTVHIILSVLTLGLWLIVYLAAWLARPKPQTFELTADSAGKVTAPQAPVFAAPRRMVR